MTIIEDTTEKLLKENSIASGGLLKSGEIPHSDIILKRTISCPSTLMDQTVQAQVHTDGNTIPQINHSILKASMNKSRMMQSGKTQQTSSITSASALKAEAPNTESPSDVGRRVSNVLTIGLIGAKVASFFFAIQTFIGNINDIGEENYENVDIDDI